MDLKPLNSIMILYDLVIAFLSLYFFQHELDIGAGFTVLLAQWCQDYRTDVVFETEPLAAASTPN